MRDEMLDRLRNLRKRAEQLNDTLAGDLQPFLHALDSCTFRRLPTSRSAAGDVSATTTCTGLMALAVTKERELFAFWKSIRLNPERAVRSALDLVRAALASTANAKSPHQDKGVDRDLVHELLSASDSLGVAARLVKKDQSANDHTALPPDAIPHLLEMLCEGVEGLVTLAGWANTTAAGTPSTKPQLAVVMVSLKTEAHEVSAVAKGLPDGAVPGPLKGRVTRCQKSAESLTVLEGVDVDVNELRLGKRPVGTVAEPGLGKLLDLLTTIAGIEWRSSLLEEDNSFTAAMFLRTCALAAKYVGGGDECKKILRKKDNYCQNAETGRFDGQPVSDIAKTLLEDPDKTLVVGKYPAASTLGYWLIDAIDALDLPINEDQWKKVASWANGEFTRQATLVSAKHDALMDPIAMAMAACMLARLARLAQRRRMRLGEEDYRLFPSPAQLLHAIRDLFRLQGESGIWPKYFPLFHYPDAGANYCFSFEMLEGVLAEFGLQDRDDGGTTDIIEENEILKGLDLAVRWCEQNRMEFTVSDGTTYRGWNSGGQIKTLSRGMPEAWATGVVHMFLSRLRATLSRSIQRRVLRFYNVNPVSHREPDPSDWMKMIDMRLDIQGADRSLKEVIEENITAPLLEGGGRITSKVRRSALLFGPPGTSKTSIVKALAKKIAWPFLEVNPSHFLNEGLERIYVRADELFEELMDLTGVIVLFDEMDALVQRRNPGGGSTVRLDVTRQFLTTSMLPKLSKLYDRGGVLFFMATNYQSEFDEAIKRPRRFDLLLCMAPPLWKAKLDNLGLFLKARYEKIETDELAYVKDKLATWASTGRFDQLLDRFSFDETRVFLEFFFEGKPLKNVVDDPNGQAKFTRDVTEWGQKFITLRETGDTYPIYLEKDKNASRIQ